MEKSKLVEILKTFSHKEIKKFEDFLNSPFFNKNKKVIFFFNYLQKFSPGYNGEGIKKEEIFKNVFKNENYDKQKIFDLSSELIKLLRKFFSVSKFTDNDLQKDMHFLSMLQEKNLLKFFESSARQVSGLLDKLPESNEVNLYYKFEFNNLMYLNHITSNRHTIDINMKKASDYLNEYFILTKLKLLYDMVHENYYYSSGYEIDFLDEIKLYLTKSSSSISPAIKIFYELLLTLLDKNHEKHFKKTIELINRYHKKIDIDTLYIIYDRLQRYCIHQINEGKPEYEKILLDLYKKSLILEDARGLEQIDSMFYKNIVTLALRLNEVEWAVKFTNESRLKLPHDLQENAYKLNTAKIFFHNRKFDEALNTLHKVDYTDIFYSLDAKSLLIMIYFELGEIDGLESMLDAFRHFLKRNKRIPGELRTSGFNFIKFINKLARVKFDNKNFFGNIRKEISDFRQVANKKWLLDKVEELNL